MFGVLNVDHFRFLLNSEILIILNYPVTQNPFVIRKRRNIWKLQKTHMQSLD
jgi:hypothetical protein